MHINNARGQFKMLFLKRTHKTQPVWACTDTRPRTPLLHIDWRPLPPYPKARTKALVPKWTVKDIFPNFTEPLSWNVGHTGMAPAPLFHLHFKIILKPKFSFFLNSTLQNYSISLQEINNLHLVTAQLNLDSSWEWQSNQLDHHPTHPTQSNF